MGKDKDKDKRHGGGSERLNVMTDGSYSWEQPDSNGKFGWEGFCGQTATANLITTYQPGSAISPSDVSRAANDWTPGSQPSTLMRAISSLANDAGRYATSHERDLSSARPLAPIVCLLQWSGDTYHYVSVVGVRGGNVIFNHWGFQDSQTEADFTAKWSFENGGGLVATLGLLSPYTSIRFS